MDAVSNPASAAMSTGMQLSAAMVKMENQVMQQQGQAMVELVQSASAVTPSSSPQGSLGHNLDVMA